MCVKHFDIKYFIITITTEISVNIIMTSTSVLLYLHKFTYKSKKHISEITLKQQKIMLLTFMYVL